jgi:hypothetical protein
VDELNPLHLFGLTSPKLDRKRHRRVTRSDVRSSILDTMRGAFVVQLGPESKPTEDRFEGWVKEVDSCTELRFRSGEELLKFLGQRFELLSSGPSSERT